MIQLQSVWNNGLVQEHIDRVKERRKAMLAASLPSRADVWSGECGANPCGKRASNIAGIDLLFALQSFNVL